MDWSATMLAAAGVAAAPSHPLDGVSLLPVLQDPSACFHRIYSAPLRAKRGEQNCRTCVLVPGEAGWVSRTV